jgi:hypothetical protein
MGHSNHVDSEGNNIPSVSQIPGMFAQDMSGFEDWICRGLHGKEDLCCTKAKRSYYEEAANLGNDIHSLREAFLLGRPFSNGVPEYQARVFDPVARFYKESGYKPLFIEEQMTGKMFGGTLDGAGTFSVPFWEKQRKTFWANFNEYVPTTESIWIEDLKIKSKLDPLHPLQLYGYRELMKETKGITADWGLIIRREKKLDKTPEIQLKAYYLPVYKEYWDASIKMWGFING